MVRLLRPFSQFQPIRVLVLGDLMLDTYTTGKVERISPEAPVPILRVKDYSALPGGAGNVVLNLLSLGAQVICAGRVGRDDAGQTLKRALFEAGADIQAIVTEEGFTTPVKNRLIADHQQLMRIDHEESVDIARSVQEDLMICLEKELSSVHIVAISDYGKGLLTKSLLEYVIKKCQRLQIPVIVDPKGNDFSKYRGATLVKPNFKEALAAAKLAPHVPLDEVARRLLDITEAEMIMVTLSEKGIALYRQEEGIEYFEAHSKEVVDVTGAGDTVLAVITLALGNQLPIENACQLANVAAGIAIEKVGCVRITLTQMSERLLAIDSANKIYNEDHLFALKHILKASSFNLLALESYEEITVDLFKTIKKLAAKEEKLLLYCSELDSDLVSLLMSLKEVSFVILKSESLTHLCQEIAPKEVYIFKEGELIEYDHHSLLIASLAKPKSEV